jgi:hypothetical protein
VSQHRVVVENVIGRLKKWRIFGSKFRHYFIDRDEAGRDRLELITSSLCRLSNWLAINKCASGKPQRAVDWKPIVKSLVAKLRGSAEGAEFHRFTDFEKGKKTPKQLGISAPHLTEEQEILLCHRHYDEEDTCSVLSDGRYCVDSDTNIRTTAADESAVAHATSYIDIGTPAAAAAIAGNPYLLRPVKRSARGEVGNL